MSSSLFLDSAESRMGLDERGWLYSLSSLSLPIEWAGTEGMPILRWDAHLDNQPIEESWQVDTPVQQNSGYIFRSRANGVMVEITVIADTLGSQWRAQITNQSQQTVTRFDYWLAPVNTGPEWSCTIPYCAGWTMPLAYLKPGDNYALSYPAKASMQWIDLYTPVYGLYFGVHDPLPLYKQLEIQDGVAQPCFGWHFPDLYLQPGESITLPPVYLVPHTEDWTAGAAIYRSWATEYIHTPDTPAWYKTNPTWAWVGLRGQHEPAFWHTTADLPELSKAVADCGINLVQLTAYTEQGHDTLYPDYRPGPSLGGEDGLCQAVEVIHQAGRKMSIYTNGRIVDPASSLSDTEREAWSVQVNPDAGSFQEVYGSVTFDVMCPGAPGWRKCFHERLTYLVKTFDVDGIYIDQVSAAPSLPCYANSHDHEKPNLAWAYYRKMLAELRQALKAIKTDLFLATEGVNDLLGQYFDSQQSHQDWAPPMDGKARPLDTLYRVTFPNHLFNSGCVTNSASGMYFLKLSHLTGSGFDFGIEDWSSVPPNVCDAARFAVGWRSSQAEALQTPPQSVAVEPTGMRAFHFTHQDVTLINAAWLPETVDGAVEVTPETKISLAVTVPTGGSIRQVSWAQPGSSDQAQWTVENDQVQIRLPFAEMLGIRIDWELV